MTCPEVIAIQRDWQSLQDARFDCVVLLGDCRKTGLAPLHALVERASRVDARIGTTATLAAAPELPGGRIVFSPLSAAQHDCQDVRSVADAARAGVALACDAGALRPLLLLAEPSSFPCAEPVALLAALATAWEPLERRESCAASSADRGPQSVGLAAFKDVTTAVSQVRALEEGRWLARDLCGGEPERMRPERFAAACGERFADSAVSVTTLSDVDVLAREYPLLMAVGRASLAVQRHRPSVVRLMWSAEGPIRRTLLLAGKGVTYDTGGVDLKVGGHMAGMSRDKGGAAAVAGIVHALSRLQPTGLRVIAELGLVRNSVGPDAYVSDEILVSHAGVRVRVGNTDAEGRLVLTDLLSQLRRVALTQEQPHLLSLATLTGHAAIACGPYSVALDNGPAADRASAASIARVGEHWGDPFEVSRLRREDYAFVQARSSAEDVVSANSLASAATPRGHQYPAAFLDIASGLVNHGRRSSRPLPFTHIDLCGSAVESFDWQCGRPTAAPVIALSAWAARLDV